MNGPKMTPDMEQALIVDLGHTYVNGIIDAGWISFSG